MMFCERCGCELPDGAGQCPECGRPVSGKVIINTDRRNGMEWPILIISTVISAAITFCLTYFWNFFFIALLFPIFLFGGRRRSTFDYVMSGVFIGLIVGCVTGWFVRFILSG